jgi:hypothetical protein
LKRLCKCGGADIPHVGNRWKFDQQVQEQVRYLKKTSGPERELLTGTLEESLIFSARHSLNAALSSLRSQQSTLTTHHAIFR